MALMMKNGKLLAHYFGGRLALTEDEDICDCECGGEEPGVQTPCCPDRTLPRYLYLSVASDDCACIGQNWTLEYVGEITGFHTWRSTEWGTPANYKYLGTGDCALENATYSSNRYAWQLECQPDEFGGGNWVLTFASTSEGFPKTSLALLDNAFNLASVACDPFEFTGTHDWSIPPQGCNYGDTVTITIVE